MCLINRASARWLIEAPIEENSSARRMLMLRFARKAFAHRVDAQSAAT
jgi:hypothetical protein